MKNMRDSIKKIPNGLFYKQNQTIDEKNTMTDMNQRQAWESHTHNVTVKRRLKVPVIVV